MFGVMFVDRVANGMSKSGDNIIIIIMRRGVCLPMFIITVYYYISIIIIIISSNNNKVSRIYMYVHELWGYWKCRRHHHPLQPLCLALFIKTHGRLPRTRRGMSGGSKKGQRK